MVTRIIIICLGLVSFMTGCMVGPKYERPNVNMVEPNSFSQPGQHDVDVHMLDAQNEWWKHFGDPVTSELVEVALSGNYTLQAAAARVIQSEALFAQSRGRQLPDISYGLSRQRDKFSLNFGGGRFSALTTTYAGEFSVSYVLDLFGKLRHATRASWAEMLSSKAAQQALVHTLIAGVINQRIQIATLESRLELARANTVNLKRTLEIVERRYAKGIAGPVEVRLARENYQAAKSSEPAISLSLQRAYHALDVLLGRQPGQFDPLDSTLAELPDLNAIAVGVPAALLDRRPDLQASELMLIATNERVGVSVAQLLPDFTLTGNYGFRGDEFEQAFNDNYEVYTAILRLSQPLFKGGQLRAQVKYSKARFDEMAADYAQQVLEAIREVEDALAADQLLSEQYRYSRQRLKEARLAEELSRERYSRGVGGILLVLESERRRRLAENELVLLRQFIWNNRVNLHLAVGGDWIEDEDVQ